MNIEISEHDLKIVLQSLKYRYCYNRDLKDKFINDQDAFDFFWNQAHSIKVIHNQLLEYIDKEKIKDDPILMEEYKEI